MDSTHIKNELDILYDEMNIIRALREPEVCERFQVDRKEEAIQYRQELIADLEADYEYYAALEEREERYEQEMILFRFDHRMRLL